MMYNFKAALDQTSETIDLTEEDNVLIRFGSLDLNAPPETVVDPSEDDDEQFLRELTCAEVTRLQARSKNGPSTLNVPTGYQERNRATTDSGIVIRPDDRVELLDGDFLAIKQIIKHRLTGEWVLRGNLLRRFRRVNNYFTKTRNELCVVIQVPDDSDADADPTLESSLVERPLNAIIQLRQITMTNMDFPQLSYRHSGKFYGSEQDIEESAELVCRWKYVEYYNLKDMRIKAGATMQLREHETDVGKGISDVGKKIKWRGQEPAKKQPSHKHAGSKKPMKHEFPDVIDLTRGSSRKRNSDAVMYIDSDTEEEVTEEQQEQIWRSIKRRNRHGGFTEHIEQTTINKRITKKRNSSIEPGRHDSLSPAMLAEDDIEYTFGDICAGAGGMSRGADLAGLKLSFMVDHWADACRTLRLNWPCAKVLEKDIFTFCTTGGAQSYMRVDILHISFPCQTYSAAHTRPIGECPNDDANEAAGYSVLPILEITRPRVVTFEQTEGLLSRHPDSFAALINQLTTMKYNVRWKILRCDEYGNVQPRKRLFIVASCPGEPLPQFPKPTHGKGPGLRRPVTIADRLKLVRGNIDGHDAHMRKHGLRPGTAPHDPHRELRQAVTTDGGEGNIHPDGGRTFTIRELASMAGFPPYHKFAFCKAMSPLQKQIGNAVPSMVGESLFREIIQSMRQADKMVEAWTPEDDMIVVD